MSNKPSVEFSSAISGIKLSGWEGERGISWQLRKSYKDKETGEWKESKYLSNWDLDAVISLAAQAKEHAAERRKAEKQAPVEAPPAAATAKYTLADDDIPF